MAKAERTKPRDVNGRAPRSVGGPEALLTNAADRLGDALEAHGEAVRKSCVDALDTIVKEGTGLAKAGPLGSAARRAVNRAEALTRSLNNLDRSIN